MKRPPDLPLIESLDSSPYARDHRPETPMQALMEAAPGEAPEGSTIEGLELRDVLADALDEVLTPIELWVFHALVIEGQSLRRLAHQIGFSKTHMARVRDQAFEKLRNHLGDHPLVKTHLHTPPPTGES